MFNHSVVKTKLGLPVIRIPMSRLESVTVLALVNTGSRYETPEKEGIAHFFEHIVFKGTQKYPDAQKLATTIDGVGANFNAFTSKEYTGYYVKAASRHLSTALDVISDMLLKPNLNQKDIDLEKRVIAEEINMYVDAPSRHVSNLFDRMMYHGSGLSHDIIGSKKTVDNVTSQDFKDFLSQWYGLPNVVLVLAGHEDVVLADETLQLVEEYFAKDGGDRQGKIDLNNGFLADNPISSKRLHVEHRETQQAHFIMGWPGIQRHDDRRYALSLFSIIMGGNMSSRLFSEIREKRGLCYYVNSGVDQFHDTGLFSASAGVDPSRVEEAIKATLDELESAANGSKEISSDELSRAKDYITGKMVLGFEDGESVAQYFGLKQLLLGEIESPEEVMEKLKKVTIQEVISVAKDVIKTDETRFAVIGPFKDREKFEKLINL